MDVIMRPPDKNFFKLVRTAIMKIAIKYTHKWFLTHYKKENRINTVFTEWSRQMHV